MASIDDFESRLAKYPTLHTQINRLFDIVENTEGDVKRADDAEDQVTDALRTLGLSLLTNWAEHCEAQVSEERHSQCSMRRDKKNSAGTVAMGLLR